MTYDREKDIEGMARAIFEGMGAALKWDKLFPETRQHYIDRATAAYEACEAVQYLHQLLVLHAPTDVAVEAWNNIKGKETR